MAKWARCSERQVQRNVRLLESWGVLTLIEKSHAPGWSPTYVLDTQILVRTVAIMGGNPSPFLVSFLTLSK